MAVLRRAAVALCFTIAAAQEAAAPETAAQAAPAEEEKQNQIVCPVRGGGYDDRYAVAQLLILQKNIPQAEACLLEAVQVSLGSIALMSDIAAAQRLPLRAAAFSSVLEQLNPTDGETVYLHAQRLGQASKWEDALAPLLRLRESNPGNANIANSLGAAYYQTFHYEKAISAFEAAAQIAPKNEDFVANLAKARAVAAGEEAHDKPMAEAEEAIALKKDEATA